MTREKKYVHLLQARVSKNLQASQERMTEKSGLAVAPAARLYLSAGLFSLEKKLPTVEANETKSTEE